MMIMTVAHKEGDDIMGIVCVCVVYVIVYQCSTIWGRPGVYILDTGYVNILYIMLNDLTHC